MISSRIRVLDGLRGYAILGVIWHHVFAHLTPPGFQAFHVAGTSVFPFTLFANGWLGVNLFFMLSGFVLFLPYVSGHRALETWSDYGKYLRHRARRLLPLYYLNLLVAFLFVKAPSAGDLFIMLTASFNFTKSLWFPPYNFVLWSLGIEIWFSIIFPGLVWLYRRQGIWSLTLLTAMVSLTTRIWGNRPEFDLGPILYLAVVKDSLLGRLDDFVWGMLACYLFVQCSQAEPGSKWSKLRNLSGQWWVVVVSLGLIFLASSLWDKSALGLLDRRFVPWINLPLQVGCFGVTLFVLHSQSRVAVFLFANPFLQTAGVMCYSLYVWHTMLLFQYMEQFSFEKAFSYLLLLSIFAYLSFRYIEFGHVKKVTLPLFDRKA